MNFVPYTLQVALQLDEAQWVAGGRYPGLYRLLSHVDPAVRNRAWAAVQQLPPFDAWEGEAEASTSGILTDCVDVLTRVVNHSTASEQALAPPSSAAAPCAGTTAPTATTTTEASATTATGTATATAPTATTATEPTATGPSARPRVAQPLVVTWSCLKNVLQCMRPGALNGCLAAFPALVPLILGRISHPQVAVSRQAVASLSTLLRGLGPAFWQHHVPPQYSIADVVKIAKGSLGAHATTEHHKVCTCCSTTVMHTRCPSDTCLPSSGI